MNSTREKILQTTFSLLIRKGFDSVSVGDIQSELGISRGLLYCYFKNKSDLVFEACKRFFFDGYLASVNLGEISLKDFIAHVIRVHSSLATCGETRYDILRYNTLYSTVIMREPRFQQYALAEFSKAVEVINNAKRRGEIKNLPANFVGATMLSILGRTTYITETPSDEYVRRRIAEDLLQFYELVRSDSVPSGGKPQSKRAATKRVSAKQPAAKGKRARKQA